MPPLPQPARRRAAGHQATVEPLPLPGVRDHAVREALRALRDDLGYETATLFVAGLGEWTPIHRAGPERPWHALLDPSVAPDQDQPVELGDVRAIPGIGARLAGLGCGSVAVLPLPGGGKVVLDSSMPSIGRSWLERARPYLSLISIMSGPAWTQDGALLAHQDLEVVARVFAACQTVMTDPMATEHDLAEDVQAALGADEAYLLTGIPDLEDGTVGPGPWGPPAPDLTDADTLARLASSLHMSTPTVAGAVGREDPLEILLAGWARGPAPSPAALGVIARTTSTARLALAGRSGAVEELMERERTEMAYALHDGLLQTVTGAILELEGLQARIREDPGEALRTLDLSKTEIRRALQELRGILFRVSAGPVARRTSNGEAFEASIRDAMARWRLPARLSVEGDLGDVPERALSAAYVTVQEALANAVKHSGSPSVSVHVEVGEGRLRVAVADRGHGFTPREEAQARADRHLGLDMLRTRVREAGGTLAIESQPGRGTRVVATLPTVEEET